TDVQILKGAGGHSLTLGGQTQEDVLRAHNVVAKAAGLLLGEDYHFLGSFRKPPKHGLHHPLSISYRLIPLWIHSPSSYALPAVRRRSRIRAARRSSRRGGSSSSPMIFCRCAGRIITSSSCKIRGSIPFTRPRSMPSRKSERRCIASCEVIDRALAKIP